MAAGQDKIAKRYARAYLEASQPSQLRDARGSLESLAAIWSESSELRSALENPGVPLSQRVAVARDVAGKIRPGDDAFANLLQMLLENKRLESIPAVSVVFGVLVDELEKLLALEVTSAFELGDQEKQSFSQHIQKEFGSLASIRWRVDPELLGGLQIKAGDRLLDNSIHGALDKMRAALLG